MISWGLFVFPLTEKGSPQTEVHSISFAAQLADIDLPLHFLGLFLIAFLQRQRFILADKRTVNRFLVGGKITINRHKAVHTFLDNMFRSFSLHVQYKDTARTNFQLNFIDLGKWNKRY